MLMKNRIYILLMICLLASCNLEPYMGYTDTIYEPIPVLLSVGTSTAGNTKAGGSIDSENIWSWKDAKVHVYSFSSDAETFGHCSTDGDDKCLIDGAADGCSQAGRVAMVDEQTRHLIWECEDSYPHFPVGFDSYDFYAYYIDDCAVEASDIVREKDYIQMPVTITGAQDIMTGRAELGEEYLDELGFDEQQKQSIQESMYSAYTAHHGVHPELYFKHHLVKLTFEAYTAREEAVNVTIQEISVKSRTNAVFTAVHRDTTMVGLDFSGDTDKESLYLMERDYKSILTRDKYRMSWSDADESLSVYDRTPLKLGGALLVAPEESYVCTLLIKAKEMDDIPYEFEINSPDGEFLEGNHYVVRLAVYGKFAIERDVVVMDWADGGNYDIDVI